MSKSCICIFGVYLCFAIILVFVLFWLLIVVIFSINLIFCIDDGFLARANSSSALFKWIFSSLRFATQPYSANAHDTSNRFIHLTNYSVNKVINLQKITYPICQMVDFLLFAISPLFYQLVMEQMTKKTQANQHRISVNVESKSYDMLSVNKTM